MSTNRTVASAHRKVSVLGATGSVGRSTLDLIGRTPDLYDVVALTANSNYALLAELAIRHRAELAVVADPEVVHHLRGLLKGSPVRVAAGPEGLIEAATLSADWIMAAIAGAAGLAPTLSAVRQGRTVALANKECLATAGDLFAQTVASAGCTLLPVDSEHSAVFQVMCGLSPDAVERIILTASGGPFRTWSLAQLKTATREQALNHPNWKMGPKITVDSATLMNKGLELIEASYLFKVPAERLDVLVHPQSIVHGLIECRDGSVLAQMSAPDMRIPIAYALGWPNRIATPSPRLDLATLAQLTFEVPDLKRFPALAIAMAAMRRGGGACTILSAANEVAVASFLERGISFLDIPAVVADTLERFEAGAFPAAPQSLDEATQLDFAARRTAFESLQRRII